MAKAAIAARRKDVVVEDEQHRARSEQPRPVVEFAVAQPVGRRAEPAEQAEKEQKREDEGEDFRLLSGSEVDILTDASLDFDEDLLSQLDCVVASIHQSLQQSEKEITNRLIKAAECPHVHMLGHMTGRLLLNREASKVNHQAVIDACAETGTWIELNANPFRFDMDWRHWRHANELTDSGFSRADFHLGARFWWRTRLVF